MDNSPIHDPAHKDVEGDSTKGLGKLIYLVIVSLLMAVTISLLKQLLIFFKYIILKYTNFRAGNKNNKTNRNRNSKNYKTATNSLNRDIESKTKLESKFNIKVKEREGKFHFNNNSENYRLESNNNNTLVKGKIINTNTNIHYNDEYQPQLAFLPEKIKNQNKNIKNIRKLDHKGNEKYKFKIGNTCKFTNFQEKRENIFDENDDELDALKVSEKTVTEKEKSNKGHSKFITENTKQSDFIQLHQTSEPAKIVDSLIKTTDFKSPHKIEQPRTIQDCKLNFNFQYKFDTSIEENSTRSKNRTMTSKIKDLQKALFENSSTYIMPPGMSKQNLYKKNSNEVEKQEKLEKPANNSPQLSPRSEISQASLKSRAKSAAPSDLLNSSGRANSLSYENLSKTGDITKNESYFSDANSTDSFVESLSGSDEDGSDEEEEINMQLQHVEKQEQMQQHELAQQESASVGPAGDADQFNISSPQNSRGVTQVITFTRTDELREHLSAQLAQTHQVDELDTPLEIIEPNASIDRNRGLINLDVTSATAALNISPINISPIINHTNSHGHVKGNILSKPFSNRFRDDSLSGNSIFSDAEDSFDDVSIYSDLASSEMDFYDSEDEMLSCLIWQLPLSDDEGWGVELD